MKRNKNLTVRIIGTMLLLCLFTLSFKAKSQNECGTPASTPPLWLFDSSLKSLERVGSSYLLNIYIHIVRSSSGSGLGNGITTEILNDLNNYYYGTGIQFNLMGSGFIDSDQYYVQLTKEEESSLFNENSHTNAIDIYVLGQSTTWRAAGLAEGIPATAFIVHGNYYNKSSLPHEMGHCLGLYHTHHGTVYEGGGDGNQCSEYVDGTNSSTCGDYIADTPADPNRWSDCTYIGTSTDAHGDGYVPDPSNIMSYAGKTCRVNFTNLQKNRMHDFINNTRSLQQVLYKLPIMGYYSCGALSGSFSSESEDHINIYSRPGDVISVNFAPIPISGKSYRWTSPNSAIRVVSTGSNKISITLGNNLSTGAYALPFTIMPDQQPTFTFVLNVSTSYKAIYNKESSLITIMKLNGEKRNIRESAKGYLYQVNSGKLLKSFDLSVSDTEQKIDVSGIQKAVYNLVIMEGESTVYSEKLLITD